MIAPIVIFVFIILVIIVYFWLTFEEHTEVNELNKISNSGQYSIIKSSPRDDISSERISREELLQQARDLNLPESTIDDYYAILEKNIQTIERADEDGIDFFIFDRESSNEKLLNMYVKRKDIVRNSNLIPPYHIKDRSIILAEKDVEKIEDYIKVPSNIETSMFKR